MRMMRMARGRGVHGGWRRAGVWGLCGALLGAAALQAVVPHAEEAPAAAAAATPYVAVARGRVDVEGGLLRLASPIAGVVTKVDAEEGAPVAAGAVLATLDTHGARLAVDSAQAELAGAQAQLQVATVRAQAAQAESKRMATAAAEGVANGQAAAQARTQSAEAQAQRGVAQAALQQARAGLARARQTLAQHRILAPVAGVVAKINTQAGETVAPDGPAIFVLLPDKPHIVRAELNESYVAAVHPGMMALVQAGDGTESWSARVLRVAPVFSPSTLADDSAQRAGARSVECVLALDAQAPLRVGQRVLVRIQAAPAATETTH